MFNDDYGFSAPGTYFSGRTYKARYERLYVVSPARPTTLVEELVACPEFSSAFLQEKVRSTFPGAALQGLCVNPNLAEEVWFKLYTTKPKLTASSALCMVSRTLSKKQLAFLLAKEKRVSIWEAVLANNFIEPDVLKALAQTNRMGTSTYKNSLKQTSNSSYALMVFADGSSQVELTNIAAKALLVGDISISPLQLQSASAWLHSTLGENWPAWEAFLGLCLSFEGSLWDLATASLKLSS